MKLESTEFITSINVFTLEEFIKINRYPTFEEMEEYQENRIDLDSEYGKWNHDQCKKLYQTMHLKNTNKIHIDNWVQSAKRTNELYQLKSNLETLRIFSPISKMIDPEHIKIFKEIYDYILTQIK
jgi:hypothetical protein